ncbi:MAG: hypothetical protein IPM24_28515 [Bryobacterales bacterium]|nr:hypothetical protein [Bryobacterales bacterium]
MGRQVRRLLTDPRSQRAGGEFRRTVAAPSGTSSPDTPDVRLFPGFDDNSPTGLPPGNRAFLR